MQLPDWTVDRLYLPRGRESAPRLALNIPSTSDHLAFLHKLDWTGLGLPAEEERAGRKRRHYWKLNTALLEEEDLKLAFSQF